MKAESLFKSQCILGEGACWHAGQQCLYWVDIEGKQLWEYPLSSGATRCWNYERKMSTIVIDQQGNLVIGTQGGLARFTFHNQRFSWIINMPPHDPHYRCNDGKCDPVGRLWMGVMRMDFAPKSGFLYCLDEKLVPKEKLNGITISNGIVWSADQKRMYYIDTPTACVKAYAYHPATGAIQFEKNAVVIPKELGYPDGMTIDEEGMLWVCHWGGAAVYRWNPLTGAQLDKIELPVPQVSSCCFGGPKMDQLFITTARERFTAEDMKKYPQSGDVFVARPGVSGVVLPVFKG